MGKVLSQAYKVLSQAYKLLSQAYKVLSQAYKVLSQTHGVLSQAHGVLSQAHGGAHGGGHGGAHGQLKYKLYLFITYQTYRLREAFIKKKSVTFFTLRSDPPPYFPGTKIKTRSCIE